MLYSFVFTLSNYLGVSVINLLVDVSQIRMADNQQQNGSQQFENTEGQQQQQHLNGTADNSNTNNDSGQFECVRDDDRSDKCHPSNRVNCPSRYAEYYVHNACRRYGRAAAVVGPSSIRFSATFGVIPPSVFFVSFSNVECRPISGTTTEHCLRRLSFACRKSYFNGYQIILG